MEVIKLFEEKGTVDEIGTGSSRAALSDSLFPGTSALHTQVWFFCLIPWNCRFLESRATPAPSIVGECGGHINITFSAKRAGCSIRAVCRDTSRSN
jgi:hypothetical protein